MAVVAMQNALAMGHNGLHILEVSVIRLALSLLCIAAEMIFLVFADRIMGLRSVTVRTVSPVSLSDTNLRLYYYFQFWSRLPAPSPPCRWESDIH